MDVGKYIKSLRTESGMTQEQLGELVGVKKAAVQKWESGMTQNLKRTTIQKLADIFNVSPAAFVGNEVEPSIYDKYDNIQPIRLTKKYPLLGDIACGQPLYCEESGFVECSDDIDADFCLICKGDSMINARIYDGDIVFIKSMPTVENGQIAAVSIDNEATLKRVYYYPDKNKLVLTPENPEYEPLVYVNEELNDIRILGKAVKFLSSIR